MKKLDEIYGLPLLLPFGYLLAHGGERRAGATAADEGGLRFEGKSLKAITTAEILRPPKRPKPQEASSSPSTVRCLQSGEPRWDRNACTYVPPVSI